MSTLDRMSRWCSRATRCRRVERTELVPVRREGSVDEDLLEDSKRAIEAYLHDQGYRDVVVE